MSGTTLAVHDAAPSSSLRDEIARLDTLARRRLRLVRVLSVASAAMLALGVCVGAGLTQVRHQLSSCRARLIESRQESSAIAAADSAGRRVVTAATGTTADTPLSGA